MACRLCELGISLQDTSAIENTFFSSSILSKRLQNGERKIEKTTGDSQKDRSLKLGVVANINSQQFLPTEVYDDSFFLPEPGVGRYSTGMPGAMRSGTFSASLRCWWTTGQRYLIGRHIKTF